MLLTSLDALIILGYADAMEDLEQWPVLLRLVYLKGEETEVAFTVGFMKSVIRDLPLDGDFAKGATKLRKKMAYEILEREYPKDTPRSKEEQEGLDTMFGEIDQSLQEEVNAREEERAKEASVNDSDEGAKADDSEEAPGTGTEA